MTLFYDFLDSPIGAIYLLITAKDLKLAGVSFVRPAGARRGAAPARLSDEFNSYFHGHGAQFNYPIVFMSGTTFEREVWLALRKVPYGQTRSYKWLSQEVGRPGASRAVGQALSRNPLPIVLPCHRIIESGGGLGGYSPDIAIKRKLLEMEYYQAASK
ncbi:MAG: methylated-DNA--[protein]-cysteine S-methyltransferase [Nitrospiraceae bacterium]|nr:methylated-DNA--[protein]-cysteine S-methyltransferase [Nitrospiraceae bacterium]